MFLRQVSLVSTCGFPALFVQWRCICGSQPHNVTSLPGCHVNAECARTHARTPRLKGAANYDHTSQRKYNFYSWLVPFELHLQKKKHTIHCRNSTNALRGVETNSDELVTSKETTDSTFFCHEDKETASQMDAERTKGKKQAR